VDCSCAAWTRLRFSFTDRYSFRDLTAFVDRIHLSGHSAGGHLGSLVAVTDWPSFASDLPVDLVKSALLLSGCYDVIPWTLLPWIDPNISRLDENSFPLVNSMFMYVSIQLVMFNERQRRRWRGWGTFVCFDSLAFILVANFLWYTHSPSFPCAHCHTPIDRHTHTHTHGPLNTLHSGRRGTRGQKVFPAIQFFKEFRRSMGDSGRWHSQKSRCWAKKNDSH
jgi:hypothetical protein